MEVLMLALHTLPVEGVVRPRSLLSFGLLPGSGSGLMKTVPSGKQRRREPKHPCSMRSIAMDQNNWLYLTKLQWLILKSIFKFFC